MSENHWTSNQPDAHADRLMSYADRLDAMVAEVRSWGTAGQTGVAADITMLPAALCNQYVTIHAKMAAFAARLRERAGQERRTAERQRLGLRPGQPMPGAPS